MDGRQIIGPKINFVQQIADQGIGKFCFLFRVLCERKKKFYYWNKFITNVNTFYAQKSSNFLLRFTK